MDDLRFYILLTVFQSYQDNGWVIMIGCMQWNPVYNGKVPSLEWGSNLGLLDQQASAYPTELTGLQIWDRNAGANSADPDQTAPFGAV